MSPTAKGCLIVVGSIVGCVVFLVGLAVLNTVLNPDDPEGRRARAEERAAEQAAREAAAAAKREKWLTGTAAGKLCAKHPDWTDDQCELISGKRIAIGMDSEQVRTAWGKPHRVNRTFYGTRTHEQWVMSSGGGSYVYFENGIVTSIQTSSGE